MTHGHRTLQMLIWLGLGITAFATEPLETSTTEAISQRVDDVLTAWRSRQTRVRTFEFTWDAPPGGAYDRQSYQEMVAPMHGGTLRKFTWGSLKVNNNTIRHETYRWFFNPLMEYSGLVVHERQGGHPETHDPYLRLHFHNRPKYFHDFKALTFSGFREGPTQRRDPRQFTSITQDGVRTELFAKGSEQYDQVRILNRNPASGSLIELSEELIYLPLLLMYRPIESNPELEHSQRVRIVYDHNDVNGFDCLVIETHHESGLTKRFWIDPLRDCCVVRFIASIPDNTPVQLDIQYRQDAHQEWIPQEWTSMQFTQAPLFAGHARLPQVANARIETFLINPNLSESDFQPLKISTGSFVTDERTDEHYISQSGGRRRLITRNEVTKPKANYDSLNNAATNIFSMFASYLVSTWYLWIFIGISFLTPLLLRRLRQRK